MKRCRLIYRSLAKDSTLKSNAVADIYKTAQENNKKDGIVGILILSGKQFLQVLEGPVRYVNQLYHRIGNDPRHDKVELIKYELIDTPYFFDWSMKLLELDNLPAKDKEKLIKKYPYQDGHLVIPDNLIQLYSLIHDSRDLF